MMENEFKPLFQWSGDTVEDVRFWCEPDLTVKAIESISTMGFQPFDGIASFEARGFFLAGIAASHLKRPTVLIRKHKRFYDNMEHARVDFVNWKNEPESLTILQKSMPNVKRVLVVDDIYDTGNSLHAGTQLLQQLGVEVVGAFYLLNAGSSESLSKFQFPIEAILKKKLF